MFAPLTRPLSFLFLLFFLRSDCFFLVVKMNTPATIEVDILEARDLIASDSNGFSDPYVVIDPTAGFTSGAKTPIIKKTLNPVWNYNTVLVVDPSFKKIKFRVFDWDRFSKDDCLGTCSFPASMFADGAPLDVWEPLVQRPEKKRSFYLKLFPAFFLLSFFILFFCLKNEQRKARRVRIQRRVNFM